MIKIGLISLVIVIALWVWQTQPKKIVQVALNPVQIVLKFLPFVLRALVDIEFKEINVLKSYTGRFHG